MRRITNSIESCGTCQRVRVAFASMAYPQAGILPPTARSKPGHVSPPPKRRAIEIEKPAITLNAILDVVETQNVHIQNARADLIAISRPNAHPPNG
jgi:hypothetical protein